MLVWLQNKSISLRVFILAAVGVLGLIAVLATHVISDSVVRDATDEAERYSKISVLTKDLERQALQLRRREKDFFLRQDMKYVGLYDEASAEAGKDIEAVQSILVNEQLKDAVGQLSEVLPAHKAQFHKVVDTYVAIGLDEESGLQGDLRAAVHGIEGILDSNPNEQLQILMLMLRRHEKDFIMRVDRKYVDRVSARGQEFKAALDRSRFNADLKTEITAGIEAYLAAFKAYSDRRLTLDDEMTELSDIYTRMDEPFETLNTISGNLYAEKVAEAEAAESAAFLTLVVITIIMIVLALVVAAAVIKATVYPVRSLEVALSGIAGGDFNTAVPGTQFRDELGSMARTAEQLRDSAAERVRLEAEARKRVEEEAKVERERAAAEAATERQKVEAEREAALQREERANRLNALVTAFNTAIGDAVNNLDGASVQMRNTAGEMVDVADTTGRQVNSVSEAAHQMQENVSAMASAIEEFAASITEVNQQMHNANSISREAVEASDRGGKAMVQLSESSKQIEDVVKLINDIAEQTNLLALNATIEAARAGEAGKGFAVVASEVKSLANQTAKATEQITAQIADMQNVTGVAVTVIQTIGEANDRLNNVMVNVSSAVEEQQATTNEISRSVQYTSEGTQRVAAEIHEVANGAEKTGAASTEVMSAAEQLEMLAASIKREVDGFVMDVRKI